MTRRRYTIKVEITYDFDEVFANAILRAIRKISGVLKAEFISD